jgi:hypothetical protein
VGGAVLTNLAKCPWPWFGGKTHAAPHVWTALGDVEHYVEPFAGSLAVLLLRPHECNRAYHSETVNDLDGFVVNAWRSLQLHPDATAYAASWPVSEADLHARHLWLLRWQAERNVELLMGDPDWCDPKAAGYWLWGQSCWIGSGWCSGRGAWIVGADGRLTKQARSNGRAAGADRKLPHLGNDGRGVNHAGTREPGVSCKLPHLGNDGRGVNRPQAREPGVAAVEPHEWQADDFHPMTMPEVVRWFRFLSARLRHVRILNGDWRRAVTDGATKILSVRMGGGHCGVFVDPPYSTAATRDADLYARDDESVAAACREWCVEHGDDPMLRIVLAGFDGEHEALADRGWRPVHWFERGFLRGGMANTNTHGGKDGQQAREVLWLSPHCLRSEDVAAPAVGQGDLFG